jgi:hypothetical protein
MARRRGGGKSRRVDPSNRDTFGYNGFSILGRKVSALALNWCNQTLPYQWSKYELLNCLVDQHTQKVLTEAFTLHEPASSAWVTNTRNYKMPEYPRLIISIDWEEYKMLAPKTLTVDHSRFEPHIAQIQKVVDVYDRFAEAALVLQYMHKYATPAAVRALWPTALSLMPKDMIDRFQSSDYIEQPPHLSSMLGYIRETAPLIATALLAPEAPKVDDWSFSIVFTPEVNRGGEQGIWRDWEAQQVPLV